MGTFSQNLQLLEPTPGDPAVKNVWGGLLNTDFSLLDSAIAGIFTFDVSTSLDPTKYILSSIAGQPDQARNARFVFTGALTANMTIFWPLGLNRIFSAVNNTTGAFSLTLAVNNGSGAPAGTTQLIRQGETLQLASNGTDIKGNGITTVFPPGTAMIFRQAAAPPGWTQDTTVNDKVIRIVSTAGGGSGGSWTVSGISATVSVASHVLTTAEIPAHLHAININSGNENVNHTHGGVNTGVQFVAGGGGGFGIPLGFSGDTGTESTGHTHNVAGNSANAGGGTGHDHAGSTAALISDGTWRPAYTDAIVCTKD